MVCLSTSRLTLSSLVDSDWDDFLAMHQDSLVNHFVRAPDPVSRIRAKFISGLQPWVYDSGEWVSVKIASAEHGFMGVIGFFCEDNFSARIQVGYMLHPAYQGQGFATEALTAILDWATTEFDVHKCIAYVHWQNLASIRVLEKCGFKREGLLQQNYRLGDAWVDEVLMGKVMA
ncbi:GNAT family N-acetyltransferase [Shewanella sp. NIFS-20-20]|uniref:GNAT family N-acetyltransferase n=1 Tax=Shewanella sp. NIFS-20-20 TaxID=2853806 RepID=UPI001C4971EF|nr:GNAT family N-acetyltransferase [Shewanella sp. NIFS-20-20]MBV7315188.1 GNAT family N-acetyltransferase [Shewanella sp. NIFS-20-20]